MSAHTKGPWHMHDMERATVCGPDRLALADCNARSRPMTENDANAALIAAAPDLLEVVKLALACEPEDWEIWHEDARAALSKSQAPAAAGDRTTGEAG